MDNIEKLLRKIRPYDRSIILLALQQIFRRDFTGLDLKKLKGYLHIFRVRVGNYRIIYFDDGQEIILKAIKRRDESTYSDF